MASIVPDHHHTLSEPSTSASTSSNRPSRNRNRNRRRRRGPPTQARDDTHNSPSSLPIPERTTTKQPTLNANALSFVPASILPVRRAQRVPHSNFPATQPQRIANPTHPVRNAQSVRNRALAQSQRQSTQPPLITCPQLLDQMAPKRTKMSADPVLSTAPELGSRIHEDILNGSYDCAVCTAAITKTSDMYSCRTCYIVFHLECAREWANSGGNTVIHAIQAQDPATRAAHEWANIADPEDRANGAFDFVMWRCPGCNTETHDRTGENMICWCGKEYNPAAIPGVPPRSCGQSCRRRRDPTVSCPHEICTDICHAGPCSKCPYITPPQSCYCGKEVAARPCSSESGWGCGQLCAKMMACGKHRCQRACHKDPCGDCEYLVSADCYCGKSNKHIRCHEVEEKQSLAWIGGFCCNQPCGRKMDCSNHYCEKICHPQDQAEPHCVYAPDRVNRCPCGKTLLDEIDCKPRLTCTDPVPNCNEVCSQPLDCGHPCQQSCHAWSCPPCTTEVAPKCRCHTNTITGECHQMRDKIQQCSRVCKTTLFCGRHQCAEICCPGHAKAIDRRHRQKKKQPVDLSNIVAPDVAIQIEREHTCSKTCGRDLDCGRHQCQDPCHAGSCNPCTEFLHTDLACNCGKTRIEAPVRCGTVPPRCRRRCKRPQPCGHPGAPHTCHSDYSPCFECPFLVKKPCICGKTMHENQPCSRPPMSCGVVCGKTLKCGSHKCQKPCHPDGECEDADKPCPHKCGEKRAACDHSCVLPCHSGTPCNDDIVCRAQIIVFCPCKRQSLEVLCLAPAGSLLPTTSTAPDRLTCDDECARLERNRRLASALRIPDDHTDTHIPYSATTLKLYAKDKKWTQIQESLFLAFAADPDTRHTRFKPMKRDQRRFLHSLAEDFGLGSRSTDHEPHRYVEISKGRRFVAAPMKSLAMAAVVQEKVAVEAKVQAVVKVKAAEPDEDGWATVGKGRARAR